MPDRILKYPERSKPVRRIRATMPWENRTAREIPESFRLAARRLKVDAYDLWIRCLKGEPEAIAKYLNPSHGER